MTTKDQQLSTTIPMSGFENHYFIKGIYKNPEGESTTLWLTGYSVEKKWGNWSHVRMMAKPLDQLTIDQVEGLESHYTNDGSMIKLTNFQKVPMHKQEDDSTESTRSEDHPPPPDVA